MKNIHIIPTEKPSRLYTYNGELGLAKMIQYGSDAISNQHIYITNSEEIEEGDWYLVELFNIDRKSKGLHIEKCTKLEDVWCNNFDIISTRHKNNCKKIILTDDKDLITDGVQAIDDEFIEFFVKNPSCEEVEVYKEYNEERIVDGKDVGDYIYKIIILTEEAKLQQNKNKYSEEEVLAFGKSCFYKGFDKAENDDTNCYTAFKEEIVGLFKRFKKK